MNTHVLQMKDRLPPGVRSVLAVNYYRAINFFPTLLAIGRSTRILLLHLSADIVPGFYWRRVRRRASASRP